MESTAALRIKAFNYELRARKAQKSLDVKGGGGRKGDKDGLPLHAHDCNFSVAEERWAIGDLSSSLYP